jgi:hypothetical protein
MSDAPRLLVGTGAIADHARIPTRLAQHLINSGAIPVWRSGGTPMSTATALDEWSLLKRQGKF